MLQNIMSGTGIFCQGEGMQKYTILGIKLYDYGAREALRLASHKLPVKTKIIAREEKTGGEQQ